MASVRLHTPTRRAQSHFTGKVDFDTGTGRKASLLAFSSLISVDFWVFLSFPSDRGIFSTFARGYKNTAIAEKREGKPRNPD